MTKRINPVMATDQEVHDIIVIGGGITGAGIAREAAWSGYRTLLLDKGDFAQGTSSRSSKLLHGGLRYLENYEFGLVFEAVRERMQGYRIAPHLVEPLPFLFPQYEGDRPGMFIMNIGLWLYDAMAGFKSFGVHKKLNAQQFAAMAPGIDTNGLLGGFRYYDAQTNDARLTLEAIISAKRYGAECHNRMKLVSAEKVGELWKLKVRDLVTNQDLVFRTRTVMLAVGPWLDELSAIFGDTRKRMRPTKGVHLLVDKKRLPIKETVVVLHPDDGRVMFAIPWENAVVIGTTDTDHPDATFEPIVTKEDVLYALRGANHLFPQANLVPADVVTSYAGLRPLIDDSQEDDEKDESEISREHSVFKINDNVFAIAGGKLTTWRVMASDGLKPIAKTLKSMGRKRNKGARKLYKESLPGGIGLRNRSDVSALGQRLERQYDLAPAVAKRLALTWGERADKVVNRYTEGYEDLGEGLCAAMVLFSVNTEAAQSVDDMLRRRTNIFYDAPDQGRAIASVVVNIMGHELGWSDDEQKRQLDEYIAVCDHYLPVSK